MPVVFVSVGSNVERERNTRGALQALRASFGPLLVSPVYETDAVGFDGAPFYNLAVAFFTELAPREVLAALSEIEAAHGRERPGERFAPRTLDLDLLLYGDSIVNEVGLKLPRPEITEHTFVLEPLAQLAPDLSHPAIRKTFAELWQGHATAGAGRPATNALLQ